MSGWQELLTRQVGIVTTAQAVELGLTPDQVRHRVRRGSWRRILPGVFVTHTGDIDFGGRVWAAVLFAGPRAVASHRTAARLQGLSEEEPRNIEVTVSRAERLAPRPGLLIRRSPHVEARRHPVRLPPRTRVEDTVLDLVAAAGTDDDVVTWVLRACQRRITTPARLLYAAAQRTRLSHRPLLLQLVREAETGVASALEQRYRRHVEVAHGLPAAERNGSWVAPDGRRRYFDVRYKRWRLRVELEGLEHHPSDRSWVDAARDNAAVLLGDVVLRYGWRPVVVTPCQVAAQVAAVLTRRGWTGRLMPCGPPCSASLAP